VRLLKLEALPECEGKTWYVSRYVFIIFHYINQSLAYPSYMELDKDPDKIDADVDDDDDLAMFQVIL
jgi:hypothetical protein